MANLKTLAPWIVYYKKVNAMFKNDPEVTVVYDEDNTILKLFVDNPSKADALSQILPSEKEFGNVTLYISVIPSNAILQSTDENIYNRAFERNNALLCVISTKDLPGFPSMTYVIFNKEVVQFYTDNLGDYNGVTSTLYQDIAKDIFIETPGVYFCTNVFTTGRAVNYNSYRSGQDVPF